MSGDVLCVQIVQDPGSFYSSGAVTFPDGKLVIGKLLI